MSLTERQQTLMRWFDTDPSMGTVTSDNATTFYTDGESAFQAIAQDLASARERDAYFYLLGWSCDQTVHLQPTPVLSLEDALRAFATAGGKVRAMLWDNQIPNFPAGCAPATTLINGLPGGQAILDKRTPIAGSHHQKMQAVVLGNGTPIAAYCGGMDLFPDRLVGGPGPAPLHDVHARVAGSATLPIINALVERWNDHPLRPSQTALPSSPLAALDGHDLVQVGRTLPRFEPGYATFVNVFNAKIKPRLPVGTATGDMNDGTSVRLYGFYPTSLGVQQVWRMLRHGVKSAQKFIYIEDQYLVSESVGKMLGVKLHTAPADFKLVILLGYEPDFPQVWVRRRAAIAHLTAADPLKRKWRIHYRRTDKPSFYVHSKTWIFDDELVITGSANADRRGMTYNSELDVAVSGDLSGSRQSSFGAKTVAQQLRCQLWAKHLGGKPGDYLTPGAGMSRWFSGRAVGQVKPYDPNAQVGAPDPYLAVLSPGQLLMLRLLGKPEDVMHDDVEDPDAAVPLTF